MTEPLESTRAETPSAKRFAEGEPRRIGRYRLGELLGEGGMGAVYAAEQLEPVRRPVALKVIRAGGRASGRIVARFELERQVLALLEHPNIARLYDAGVTPEGDPYFVMERVEGLPITRYADRARLSVRARIELFLDVCHAIEHAHQKGILHRDLKPSRADLERFLNDRPVLASPPSLAVKAKKFVRRNRLAVAAAALIALSLLAGVVATSVALVRSRRAEARAASEAAKATAVNQFLTDMLASASPLESGREVKVADLLDRASADLPKTFAGRLEVEAALHLTLSKTYDGLGLADAARREVARALAIRRRVLGPNDLLTLEAQGAYAYSLLGAGELQEALALAEETLAAQSRILSPDDPKRLETLATQIDVLYELTRAEEALPLSRDLVARLRRTLGEDEAQRLSAEGQLAQLLDRTGHLAESEALHRDLIRRMARLKGPDYPEVLAITNNLGNVLNNEEKFAEAEAVYRDLGTRQLRIFGAEHPETLTTRHNLVRALVAQGKLAEAETLCRATLEIRKRTLGPDHPHTIYSLGALGNILVKQGNLAEARQVLPDALARAERVLGPDHNTTKRARDNLAKALAAQQASAKSVR